MPANANATEVNGVADRNWTAFQRAYQGHDEYIKMAKKCSDYYSGEQWDEKEKAEVEAEGRPALTINQILQVINAVRGHYSETRADFQFKPRNGPATQEVADTLTRLFDQILDANDFHDAVEPQVVEDGWIEDRGYFDIRVDFDENILGEVKIRSLDPRTVILDPDASDYDPKSWKEVFIDRWMSLDDIEATYGVDARKNVSSITADRSTTFGEQSVRYNSFGQTNGANGTWFAGQEDEATVRAVRVIERQYRRLAMTREYVELETGESRPIPEQWEEERIQAVAKVRNLFIRKRMVERVRWTVSADHTVLHDDWSPYNDFTVVPYFPIFRRGNPSGLVRHLLDPQEQFNKIESQILHVINTTANSGWTAEAGSLVNMDEEELASRGAETGLVIIHKKNSQPPQKIQPNQIPTGLENYAAKAQNHIHNIPGAAALLGGAPKAEVSGVALSKQQTAAVLGLQVAFDNLQRTRKLIARRILDCVQKFYSESRVYYVTNWQDPEEPQEEVAINQRNAAGEVVNDITLGEFGVTVGLAPARDTFHDKQFAESISLRKEAGVAIPDHHIILQSNLANKRQIAEEVKQAAGLGEPTETQMMMEQLQLQGMQLTLAEQEAKVTKLRADAGLADAKAQTEVASEQREMFDVIKGYEMEIARLRQTIDAKSADLNNKLQLAAIHSQSKEALTRYGKTVEGFEKENDRELQRDLARQQRAQQGKAGAGGSK